VHKIYFTLTLLALASLLAGCAGSAVVQSNEVIPTSLPEKVQPTIIPEVVSKSPPATCPVTVLQNPAFMPPAPYSPNGPFSGWFWYGSNSLWVAIPSGAVWHPMPNNSEGYFDKVFWWRDGYVWNEEPEPNLAVIGERLDAKAPSIRASRATNAYASDIGSAMLVGVDFPTLGCWKITGRYGDAELSFVVWVAP
jgi:hypothetical protein